jgi:hypothetical protein
MSKNSFVELVTECPECLGELTVAGPAEHVTHDNETGLVAPCRCEDCGSIFNIKVFN